MSELVLKIVELCRELGDQDFQQVFQELVLLQAGFSSTQAGSIEDVVPIDVPIQYTKNSETGSLYIEYPFSIGVGRNIGWKRVRLTPAAQVTLAHILYESLSDLSESSIQTKSPTHQ